MIRNSADLNILIQVKAERCHVTRAVFSLAAAFASTVICKWRNSAFVWSHHVTTTACPRRVMRSGTNPNVVKRKLNGRGHRPRFVAGQQIQALEPASAKEIKVPLNNVIQDTQLSPRISMVTNVPACTVSLAHQADTKETKEENLHKSN